MPDNALPGILEEFGAQLRAAMEAVERAPAVASPAPWPLRRSRASLRRPHARRRARSHNAAAIAIATGIATVVAVLVGTSGGGRLSTAFADWSATPTTPAHGQVRSAETACAASAGAGLFSAPVLADTRGPYTLLIYAADSTSTVCLAGLPGLPPGKAALTNPGSPAASGVTAGAIDVAFDGASLRGGLLHYIGGRVGSGVRAVAVTLDDGSTVRATSARGWFAAWWPGGQGTRSAEITNASGATKVVRLVTPTFAPDGVPLPTGAGASAQNS